MKVLLRFEMLLAPKYLRRRRRRDVSGCLCIRTVAGALPYHMGTEPRYLANAGVTVKRPPSAKERANVADRTLRSFWTPSSSKRQGTCGALVLGSLRRLCFRREVSGDRAG